MQFVVSKADPVLRGLIPACTFGGKQAKTATLIMGLRLWFFPWITERRRSLWQHRHFASNGPGGHL
jgi:hypothetical protein